MNIGMIGAGSISAYHIAGLQQAGARVGAIAARTLGSAQQRAQEFGIPRFTADYHDILTDPSIDAVVIATPDYLHMPHAIDALHAGKAVLLQKPMARSADECGQIVRAADETGGQVYVSFMHHYFEEIELLRKLLGEGALGRVLSVRQRNATPGADWAAWFYFRRNVGGGVLMQLGVHGIDLLRHVFGDIVSVRATTPAYCFHRAVPLAEYTARVRFRHETPGDQRDWCHMRVRQQNGHWAWSSPIWVEPSRA